MMTKFETHKNSVALEAGQLDPFAVDDSWLLTSFPPVAAIQAMLTDSGNSHNTQPLNPATVESWRSPAIDPITRIFNDEVLPHALRFRAQSNLDSEAADRQLGQHIIGVDATMAHATNAINEVVGYASSSTARFETLRRAGEEVVSAIDAPTLSMVSRYELTKLIATTIPRPQYSKFEWPARNVFTCLLFLGRSALPAQLAETAESGGFDGFIAADLVRSRVPTVIDLLRFSRAFSPEADETTIQMRLIANYSSWPKDQAAVLKDGRQQLSARYERAVGWAQSPAGAGDFLQVMTDRPDPVTALTAALEKYFGQVERLNNIALAGIAQLPPRSNKRRTNFEAGRTHRQRRRQTAGQAGTKVLTEVFKSVEAERAVPNWELAVLRPDGLIESGEAADAVMASLRQDYLDEYETTPVNHPIMAVVEKILEEVRHLDFSTGNTPGVNKLSPAAIKAGDNTDTSYALMEYKPKQVPGASLKVKDADKLRVLFAMTGPNTLGLLKVIKRPDITAYLRRVGIKGYISKG